jgi:hypothetical protein
LPSNPIKIELDFPFDYLVVDYNANGEMRVNYQVLPYQKLTCFSAPEIPNVGCQHSIALGNIQSLERFVVSQSMLQANSIEKKLLDFPMPQFTLGRVDIERVNQFLSWGFTHVEFIYALYKPVTFISCGTHWINFYIRVEHRTERDN